MSERLGHTLGMVGAWGSCRDLCCDDGCDDVSLRLAEALPLSERLGHAVLGLLEGFAAIVYKLSEAALLGWGSRENTRLLMMFEVASLAWSMQNSPGAGDSVPHTLCLEELVPDGTSQPSHVGLPSALPPDLPRRPDGLPWAPRCSPQEWTAWCRVRDGLDQSNEFFEVVQVEPEVEEVFDLTGIAEAEGWDPTELMYFVFEFGTKKGMKYCREYYDMKNSAPQVVPQLVVEADKPVFDLVGVAEAEGWDQTQLMFFVFEYGVEIGVSFCREYYEMKSQQEVRQAVCPEPTKEAKIQFLFRGSGGLRVQEVEGGMTLDEWFASQADLGVGLDGYFTTLGGKVLNSKVGIGSLGLGSFQEVVFHCRLRGGANKGSGRVDSPNLGEWQCSFCMAPHCWQTKMACYRCGTPRYWESGVMGQGSP